MTASFATVLRAACRLTALVSLAALMASCAPSTQQGPSAVPAPGISSGPKVLRIGMNADKEPKDGGLAYGGGGAGGSEPLWMFHASLTNYDDQSVHEPRIAERLPTVENGDWKVAPDGAMEVTWKLRPNVTWHDGTPLSAEDFILGFRVGSDTELFGRGTRILRQIESMRAPDPQTLVMSWKNIYIYASTMDIVTLVPLPRHKLAALYEAGDKQAFANSRAWFDEWVGLGPYRIGDWVPGSHLEGEAFAGYFLGRPKIDRINVRFFGDVNALALALMSGDIDIIPVGSLKEGEGHVLKTQWESVGGGSVIMSHNRLRHGAWQFRDPAAVWLQDVRIRQALLHLIDRSAIVDEVQNGLSTVEDIVLPRQDPAHRMAQQRGLPSTGYDVNQAHRLLAEAGLTRGAGGIYRTQGGAPFAIEISATNELNTNVQELLVISNQWKTAGVEPTNVVIPGTGNKEEMRGKVVGVNLTSADLGYRAFDSYLIGEISSEATRWRGANIGGYNNSDFDGMHKRLFGTVGSGERDVIAADMAKLLLDQMLYLPLTYSGDVAAAKKALTGVTGVVALQRVTGWNIHAWDM